MMRIVVIVMVACLVPGCPPDGPLGTVGAIVTAPNHGTDHVLLGTAERPGGFPGKERDRTTAPCLRSTPGRGRRPRRPLSRRSKTGRSTKASTGRTTKTRAAMRRVGSPYLQPGERTTVGCAERCSSRPPWSAARLTSGCGLTAPMAGQPPEARGRESNRGCRVDETDRG